MSDTHTAGFWRPGTYEVTKRIEVDDDGRGRFVDVPGGVSITGLWPSTLTRVTPLDDQPGEEDTAGLQSGMDWRRIAVKLATADDTLPRALFNLLTGTERDRLEAAIAAEKA